MAPGTAAGHLQRDILGFFFEFLGERKRAGDRPRRRTMTKTFIWTGSGTISY
jgi:hypothetical protein